MSTEEESPAVAASDEEIGATNGAAAAGENKKPNKGGRRKDEKPVEELYDLTKPIPKVEKPNKDQFEKELQALTDEIEALKDARNKIQEKIETTMADADAKSGLQEARNKLNELKGAKNALIEEKKVMRAQLDSVRNQTDKLLREKKDARSNVKFNSVDEIEKEIQKLQKRQETTSMSLNDEKKLIKEIDALKASRKYVAELKSTDASIDDVKEQKKNIAQSIGAKDKEIDEYAKQIKEVMESIEQLNLKDNKKKDVVGELFKERDDLKKQMNLKIAEKDLLRADFRTKNDAFYSYQRAVRKQKQMQYEEEKAKREEEKAAYLAKLEEEEAKKIPYEEEQGLCDFLADYLERTYMKKTDSDAKDSDADKKNSDFIEVKDDPFAGLTAINKKNEDEEYFGKGKGKKKRVRQAKKQDAVAGPFTLSVDTFEQFGLLQLTPPTSIEQVEASIKQLREKKEWYKVQPRGSVPTASDIRKANEKAAAKLALSNGSGEGDGSHKGSGRGGGGKKSHDANFALSNDDFAPLGSGSVPTASTLNPSWGKVSSSQPAISNETPTPAEAAAAAEE